jgi:hypothetical protein
MHIRAGAKGSVGFVIFKEKLFLEILDLQNITGFRSKIVAARMSESGQTEKNSVRAYVFRFALELGHRSTQSACLKRAKTGSGTMNVRKTRSRAVCTDNLNAGVAVMKSAQDGA